MKQKPRPADGNAGKKNKQNLAAKIVLRIVTVLCLAAAAFFAGKYAYKKFTQIRIETKRTAIERQLSECAELIVYRMKYTDIVSIKKTGGLSRAYSLVRYSGIVRVGIEDILKTQIEISPDGRSLVLTIPPAVLLGNDIHSQEVFDEKQGFFAKITTQEVFDEIEAAKEAAAQEILDSGILEQADMRAQIIMRQFFSPLGFKSVVVEIAPQFVDIVN